MRLSLPTHVPMRRLLPVLGVVLVIQVVEGTKFITALEFGAFLLICADAFNAVGGLIYPSGSYIFFVAVLGAGLGGLAKTMLGEPLDGNMTDAQRSMLVYLAGACSMWVAAQIACRGRAKRPWLLKLQLDSRVTQTAVGAALIGQFGGILVPLSVISTFNQVNNFLPLAILMLAYARTKETDGWKSLSGWGFFLWAYTTVFWGIFAFTKQGMFLPAAVWAIGALIAGYRTTLKKLLLIIGISGLAAAILTPVSQVGRIYLLRPNAKEIAWDLLTHPVETRRQYQENQRWNISRANTIHWFSNPQGLLDRLTMFPIDDALMNITDHGRQLGFGPIEARIVATIPRYLMRDEKIPAHWGNRYAHELGILSKKDHGTGISFSPFADVYHCMRWWGLVIACPLFLMMFLFSDSLTGNTEQTLWAAFYIMLYSHSAAEGMIQTPFLSVSTYAFGVVLAALLARYVLPYIGGFLVPPKRSMLQPAVAPLQWQTPKPEGLPSMARTIESKI